MRPPSFALAVLGLALGACDPGWSDAGEPASAGAAEPGVGVAGETYPLFFGGTPDNEPTCVPSRPGEHDGQISTTDGDGDGIPDDGDSCPKAFTPPRPLDGGKQPDTDGDSIGDSCDPRPFDRDSE